VGFLLVHRYILSIWKNWILGVLGPIKKGGLWIVTAVLSPIIGIYVVQYWPHLLKVIIAPSAVAILLIIGIVFVTTFTIFLLVRWYYKRARPIPYQAPPITTPVFKVLGKPDGIENGVQRYYRRSHLPFDDLLAEAGQQVIMLAVTFHMATTGNIQLIQETIFRNIRITFLILDPSSRYTKQIYLHEGGEVGRHIERSLSVLCALKKSLPDELKDNLIIRTYDDVINNSIIIIDNRLIKVEKYITGSDPDSRENLLTYKTDNNAFFQSYTHEYNKVQSTDYGCP
jgi:hypothetical protein